MSNSRIGRLIKWVIVAMLSVSSAAFATTNILFDPDGPGSDGQYTVTTFDLAPGNNLLDQSMVPILNGSGGFTFYSQTRLGGLLQPGGPVVTGIGLNTAYEITAVTAFGQKVDSVINNPLPGIAKQIGLSLDATNTTNFFELWQGSKDANDLLGVGFNNGTRILRGRVVSNTGFLRINTGTPVQFDQTPTPASNNYPGQTTVTALGIVGNFKVEVLERDPAFFPSLNPGDFITFITIDNFSQTVPFVSVEPSSLFVGAAGGVPPAVVPALGTVNGSNGSDFQLQTDYNMTFDVTAAALGDFVWEDKNGNGIQDATEPGIPGVSVSLYRCDGTFLGTKTTDGTGHYLFNNLAAGSYFVQVLAPGGYVFTLLNQGAGAADSDVDPTTSTTACVTLAAGETNLTVDAGLYKPAALGDRVWYDTNQDGLQTAGEPSLTNVQVNLRRCDGSFITSTVTDGSGLYHFTGLAPGGYIVEFVLPSGYVFSPAKVGLNDALDSDANQATGYTACRTLTSGQTDDNVDAGMYKPTTAELGDFVWEDLNANGIQDAGEPGIPGVTVRLLDCSGTLLDTTTTNASGLYLFSGLVAGNYIVEFVKPGGYFFSPIDQGGNDTKDSDANLVSGRSPCTALAIGESNRTVDAGMYQPASIGDFVWNDTNQNGIQDAGEPGLGGVTVNLLRCDGTPVTSTTTSGSGFYGFINLVPGGYRVEFVLPSGYVYSPLDQGGNDAKDSDAGASGVSPCITLASGENNPTVDAGMYKPTTAELGDFVWEDLNANGIQDASEPGISGVTVRLRDCFGTLLDTTTTNASGFYLFSGLVAGGYTVEFVTPAGYTLSPQDLGGDDAKDSDANTGTGRTGCIPLATGESNRTVDAGMYRLAALGDRVWNDTNQNGIQDVGETGVGGVTVNLYRCDNSPVTSTTTNGSGIYAFTGLLPGQYYVEFIKPAGYAFSPVDQGGDDTKDSDAVIATGRTACITLNSGVTNNDTDAGIYVLQPAVSIVKSTNGVDANTPTGPYILVGGAVNWTYLVTNTGPVALSNVTVTDSDPSVTVTCPSNTLAIGATMTCAASGTAKPGQYANIGTVTGQSPAGVPVTANDPSHYFGAQPSIDIQKTPDTQTVVSGSTVTFTITVTNTGNVTLTSVTVGDIVAPGCGASLGTFAPGASTSYTCTLAGVTANIVNIATVTGTPPVGPPVTDNDDAKVTVIHPAILITKSPDMQTVISGGTATWAIVVTNTGDVSLSNVTVTDAQAPGCAASLGTLAPAASTSYTCTLANVTTDFTNVAAVKGTPPVGSDVTDDDDAMVDVIHPHISIKKYTNGDDADAGPGPNIKVGDVVTWDYVVKNDGDVTLFNVLVTDDKAGSVCTIATLAVNAVVNCAKTGIATQGQYENTGMATGADVNGNPVSAKDLSHYFGVRSAITIKKYTNGDDADAPTGPLVPVGGAVTWTYIVTNTGNVDLSAVTVSDNMGVAVSCPKTTLVVGEVMTCTAHGVATAGQYENKGSVTATDTMNQPVSASDLSHYFGVQSSLKIVKSTNGDDANSAPGPYISVGGAVNWTYVVTNTGNVTLSGVTVVDSKGVAVSCPSATLAAGASMTCTASGTATAGQYENIGTVTGTPPGGLPPVTANDPSHYYGIQAHISIVKAPKMQQVVSGGTATFNITVTNDGNVDLTGVTVTDPLSPTCDAAIGALAAGASKTYTCTVVAVTMGYTNVANVTGHPPIGPDVSASDTAVVTVIHPAISIDKSPKAQQVLSGGTATWTITVTNTGDVDLTGVTVTDPLASNCNKSIGSLAIGASSSYTCTLANVTSDFTNVANVTGTPPVGSPVTATDSAKVTVIKPAITIVKSPKTQTVAKYGTATWTITVTNTGNVDLTNVIVSDPKAPKCNKTIGVLAAGASSSYTCTLPNVTCNFTNVATVTGTPPQGPNVSASDSANVVLGTTPTASIAITKTPAKQTVISGGTATWTITVTNTGSASLSYVAVSDPKAPNCNKTIGTLAAGASTSYSCTLANVTANFTNTATVTGKTPSGSTLTASASADVCVQPGANIAITKTPATQTVLSGGTATWTITVTNTGGVTLSNVLVSDPKAPNCNKTIGTLAVGATTSYSCTLANVMASFTNTATATGTPPSGPNVSASASADVCVQAVGGATIGITKTPVKQTVVSGGTATWTITVTNTGNVTLTNVAVSDPLSPNCNKIIGTLAVGANSSYSCSLANVTAGFTNTATATGTPPSGSNVSASASADVCVQTGGGVLAHGDTATIGFWHNKNGQALINSLNGGPSAKNLATWLATQFPYLYGANSTNNLTGKTNTDVAALFLKFFNVTGQKTDAQVMGAAIAVYVTNSGLAGNAAVDYGFNISAAGTGAKVYNVGSYGTAIGLSNNQTYTVLQLLQQANLRKQSGTFDANAFNSIFDGINTSGDII